MPPPRRAGHRLIAVQHDAAPRPLRLQEGLPHEALVGGHLAARLVSGPALRGVRGDRQTKRSTRNRGFQETWDVKPQTPSHVLGGEMFIGQRCYKQANLQ